ncbi:MAG: EpsG family protein [Bacteroides sp.]|nr:EpsG family protein [Bacteroides sp.]
MTAYVILIVFIFIWRFATIPLGNRIISNRTFLAGVFVFLYFFCAIRSFDVGRDIPGYIKQYNEVKNLAWSNWKMGHFEVGYIFLMKVCSMIGMNARAFFFLIYFVILAPIWFFIRSESPRPLLSVLVFTCFQFFVFDLTGIRQAMASSLCILAYLLALKPSKQTTIWFAVLVLAAFFLHKSAIAFAIVYFIVRLPLNKKTIIGYIIIAFICAALNKAGVGMILDYYDTSYYEYSTEESQQIGGALVFVALFAVLGILMNNFTLTDQRDKLIVSRASLMVMTGICAMLLVNGSALLRGSMYFYFPIMIIPAYLSNNAFYGCGRFVKLALIAVLLFNFFTKEIHSLDVLPYEIGTY